MRVALDTNVLVSAVATRGLCADVLHLILAEHELIVGSTVLSELRRVLRRKLRVPTDIIEEMDGFVQRRATVVSATRPLRLQLRDRTDRMVLSEAVAAKADVLVTGDRDLLDVTANVPLAILSPRGFWERFRAPMAGPK